MLTPRKIEIFKAIVEEFVSTAEPVGSKALMEKYNLPYSSATIRNDMMELEEMGYLEKTHTSSGRVPSTKGYRFYCEHLLEDDRLDKEVEYQLQQVFTDRQFNMEEAIKQSCEILSQMTNLTSGVLGPNAANQRLEHIKLFPISDTSAVVVFITDTGHTENKTFHFNGNTVDDIATCCQILNDRLKGTNIQDVVEKMASLEPLLASQVRKHEQLYAAFMNAFVKFASDSVYFSGTQNMLYQPEFADIEKLKNLMSMLDNASLWRSIETDANEVAVRTNKRSQLVWKDDVAVITTKFLVNSQDEGKLMVVGPSRMDYDRIVSLLETISFTIEKFYGKGGKS